MIEKALTFREQFPKIGTERCLRGLLILPLPKDEQITSLRQFVAGKVEIMRSRSGAPIPASIADIEDNNLALDLRKSRPQMVELCDCPW
jgi:hypothetical protein